MGILLALPGILGYFLWVLGPTVVAVFMSFTDWSLASSPNWIGQQNYANLFNDFIFKKSLCDILLCYWKRGGHSCGQFFLGAHAER